MHICYGNTVLRETQPSDISDYIHWFTVEKEWMNWDAPWETWEDSDIKRFIERVEANIGRQPQIYYRMEISEKTGQHSGWVSSYNIGENLAVGIDIPSVSARGKGHGERALILFVSYLFENTNKEVLYTQTWSGNIPMIKLAGKIGFVVSSCEKNSREVNGKFYDGLTFVINKNEFLEMFSNVLAIAEY